MGLGLVYVGVGGVFTIVGPWDSVPGGVLGGAEVSSLGCGTRGPREGGFAGLDSRGASEGSIWGNEPARACETGSDERSGTAWGRLRSGLESFPKFGLPFLERKISLMRPAGEVDRRGTLFGGRSEGGWALEARDSESTEPERSLECADVLEAPSTDDVSGT